MITFTEKHMSAITDLANNVQFKPYGWRIVRAGTVGNRIKENEPIAELERDWDTADGFDAVIRKIELRSDGAVELWAAVSYIGGYEADKMTLTLSQLRVLLIAAERIAAASAESERQWQNYANERDAMDNITANLIKSAENEKHL